MWVYHFNYAVSVFLVLVACLRKTLLHSMNYSTAQQHSVSWRGGGVAEGWGRVLSLCPFDRESAFCGCIAVPPRSHFYRGRPTTTEWLTCCPHQTPKLSSMWPWIRHNFLLMCTLRIFLEHVHTLLSQCWHNRSQLSWCSDGTGTGTGMLCFCFSKATHQHQDA